MALQDKYKELLDTARSVGITNLQAREQNNVLYIDGQAPSGAAKDQLWNVYGRIDPDFRSGDVVMNINVSTMAPGGRALVTTRESNLNIRKGPGTDQPIVGKAAHNEVVTLVSKTNDQWWLVRTNGGAEGYASAQFLSPEG